MGRKKISEGLDAILTASGATASEEVEKKRNETVCFRCDSELIKKMRYIASASRLSLKDVMEEAISLALSKYEAKNGKIEAPSKANRYELF